MHEKNFIQIEAADCTVQPLEAEGGRKAQFTMRAYTGGPMRVAGWEIPVVIDLSRALIASQNIPVRLDHDPHKGVGHTTAILKSDNEINASGIISRENEYALDVKESARAGFPWRCSVGGAVNDSELIEAGENRLVNGKRIEGPCYVVCFELNEISFVDRGADSHAVASVQAKKQEGEKMADENVKEKQNVDAAADSQNVNASASDSNQMTAQNPVEKKVEAAETPPVDVAKMTADVVSAINAAAAETQKRINDIRAMGKGKYPELEAQAIGENWPLDKFELNLLRKETPASAPAIHATAPSVTGKELECAALAAAGVPMERREKMFDEKTLELAEKHYGIGLEEFCAMAVGHELPRYKRDPRGWLQAAFSTNNLSSILSNVANKMLLEGYNNVEDAWKKICKIGTVNDFKEHERYRMTTGLEYKQLAAGGQIQHGTVDEQKFGQKASTYAVAFGFDRQMMYDDDLGALLDLNRQFGVSAGESIAKTVWTRFLANPTQSDSKAFFHTGHGNKFTGSTTALSYSALTTAEKNFMALKKPNGEPLGIRPKILLCPYDISGVAETLIKSQTLNDGTAAPTGTANIHYGKFEVVSTSYLSNSSYSGYSATAWYLLADPGRLPAFEIAFLGGKQTPTIESTEADFDTLGIRFRAYIDYGFREQDYRGAIQMTGA